MVKKLERKNLFYEPRLSMMYLHSMKVKVNVCYESGFKNKLKES